jgi:hypothetical protein
MGNIPLPVLPDEYGNFPIYIFMCIFLSHAHTFNGFLPARYADNRYLLPPLRVQFIIGILLGRIWRAQDMIMTDRKSDLDRDHQTIAT